MASEWTANPLFFAQRYACEVSGIKTTDTLISNVPALLVFCHVFPEGGDCEIAVYDALSATGTILAQVQGASTDKMVGFEGSAWRKAHTGLYLKVVSGTPEVLLGYVL